MNKVKFKDILIVEDGDALRQGLAEYFSAYNHVTTCRDLNSAIAAVQKMQYDIVVLDLILPDGSGIRLLDYLTQTPVVILSDLDSDVNIINGLSAGATDYVVKPCSPEVLDARLFLRLLPESKANISIGELTLNVNSRTAVYKNFTLDLTSSEFNILMFLMQNEGTFFTANEIYENVWKMPHLNTDTIKTHISNLRKKMLAVSDECASLLQSKFGKGYAFSERG